LIEQKKLGVYQGDIKPANIRYDAGRSVCYFVDYDQALYISDEQRDQSNSEFIRWCSTHDKEKYGFGNWLRHFSQYMESDIEQLFDNGVLNLYNTTVFRTQNTTNTATGIYHTLAGNDVHIKGSRTIDARSKLLDAVSFKDNERVLDVGCNAGLLSMYLHDRGCQVTGVDNDPHIVGASKMVANILGKKINYAHLDLDEVGELEEYDTIALFSVFHHTRNPIENAKKISKACSRILLEMRLVESGKQPIDGVWKATTLWENRDLNHLVTSCEQLFKGFKFKKNLGQADKNRYILEFVKMTED
jgi:2-polyprenyl-3-methyl-5-hydroxy-6-metoxy-1,4-benzoquinol methylase